jgi:hypothetical protein
MSAICVVTNRLSAAGCVDALKIITILLLLAMYTNIEPAMGIMAVQAWLTDVEHELPESVPTHLVIKSLGMVMTYNTFQFDDTFWQQFVGTAMGTLCTCVYDIVSYGYYERTRIIPKQNKEKMPYLKRCIDDVLGIWCGSDASW